MTFFGHRAIREGSEFGVQFFLEAVLQGRMSNMICGAGQVGIASTSHRISSGEGIEKTCAMVANCCCVLRWGTSRIFSREVGAAGKEAPAP